MYKIGIVGTRSQGTSYAYHFHKHHQAKVSAICDIDPKLLESANVFGLTDSRLFTDYDEFLDSDIDIVVIGTPIPAHVEQSIKALEAGKHFRTYPKVR